MEVQDNLNAMIDEYNSMYEDVDCDPITLTKKDIENLLSESGVPEEITSKIQQSYIETFGEDLPLAESLIDSKVLKENAQREKEKHLEKQVEILQTKLQRVNQEAAIDGNNELSQEVNEEEPVVNEVSEINLEEAEDSSSETNNTAPHYDVILQVRPEKIPQIKSQIIDGQKCIVIPVNEDEQTTVNGLNDLI